MNRLLVVLFFLAASVVGQEELPFLFLSVGEEGVAERMTLLVNPPDGGVCAVSLIEDFGLWTKAAVEANPNVKPILVTTVRGDQCRRLWEKARRINNAARLKNGG